MEIPGELTQWLHAARAGCPDAWNKLSRFATSYLLQLKSCPISSDWQAREDRYDLVQETLRRFFQHFDRLRDLSPEAALRFLPFLWRGTWLNMVRRHQAQKRAAGREQSWTHDSWEGKLDGAAIAPGLSPLDGLIAGENKQQLAAVLGQLTEEEYQLVVWQVVDGWSFAEIGMRLGLTERAAQQRWLRILKRLRRDRRPTE